MTREEEIQKAAIEYDNRFTKVDFSYNAVRRSAFINGAKYADKHPAKKQKHTETIEAYMARDTGNLALYERIPTKMGYFYVGGFWTILPDDLFPNITCESGLKKVKVIIELDETDEK